MPMTHARPRRNDDCVAAESELIERAQAGDRHAFAELYRRHAPAVARLAQARAATSDSDDAVAETFARAWSSLHRYRRTGAPFVSWLYGIGRNVIADGHRRNGRSTPTADFDCLDRQAAELDDRLLDLGAALGRLKRRQRRVIELKYLAGLSNEEVARSLDISPGAVNTLQWRALRRLEAIMGGDQ